MFYLLCNENHSGVKEALKLYLNIKLNKINLFKKIKNYILECITKKIHYKNSCYSVFPVTTRDFKNFS